MSNFATLWSRELGVWFHAVSTYVTMAIFTAVTGLIFWKVTGESVGEPFDPALLLFGPIYFWLMIIVLTAIIAMRLFVDDRRTGMLEMTLTAPVTEWEIILAKYAGAMTIFATACLPLTVYPFLLSVLRSSSGLKMALDAVPLVSGFLALLLCGAFFNALGVWCAAMLRGTAGTVITVFVACSLLFVIDQAAVVTVGGRASRILNAMAITPAIRDLTRGIIDTRPLILWLSATVFSLFAAQRTLWLRRIPGGR